MNNAKRSSADSIDFFHITFHPLSSFFVKLQTTVNTEFNMPRQRRGAAPSATPARSAPSRPTAPAQPARSPYGQQQQQPHSTAAHPTPGQQAPQAQAPPQQSQGSGLFGQMASTAA